MQVYAAIAVFAALVVAICGCALKFGAAAPAAGRAETSFSWGWEGRIPLTSPPGKQWPEGDLGFQLTLPYQQHVSSVERESGLSRGRLTSQSAGVLCKLFYVTTSHHGEYGGGARLWVAAGPEYHWYSLMISDHDRSAAAMKGIVRDENMKDNWGGCVSVGREVGLSGLTFFLELSYHWAHTSTEVKWTDSGIPFSLTRRENMEWFSVLVGMAIGF
jgi:hypothetical protein